MTPWFIQQAAAAALTSNKNYAGLTSDSRIISNRRQGIVLWAYDNLLILTIDSAVIGLTILVIGLGFWWRHQKGLDESDRLEREKRELDLRKATADELHSRLREEAAAESANGATHTEASGDTSQPGAGGRDQYGADGSSPLPEVIPEGTAPDSATEEVQANLTLPRPSLSPRDGLSLSGRMNRILRIEERLIALTSEAFESSHRVSPGISARTKSGRRLVADGIAEASPGSSAASFAIDVLYAQSPAVFHNLSDHLLRTAWIASSLGPGSIPTGRRGQPPKAKANGIVHVVAREGFDVANSRSIEKFSSVLSDFAGLSRSAVGLAIWTHDEFEAATPTVLQRATVAALTDIKRAVVVSDEP